MNGVEVTAADTAAHTADTPQLLLEHHLKELRLPTILREWQTPTGSIVRVERCDEQVCLRLISISRSAASIVDIHNPDPALRTRPLCSLQIGSGFKLNDPAHATGGTLYDPKTGKTYRGSIAAQGATLHLRGYVGVPIFGASETWTRPTAPVVPCAAAQR